MCLSWLRRISPLVLALALPLAGVNLIPQGSNAAKTLSQSLELKNLTPQIRLQMVGKIQLTRGFFSDKSVPMIVDDINRLSVRQILPAGSYILLGGSIPAGLHHGDQIELQGMISRPGAADATYLKGEETFLKIAPGTVHKVLVAAPAPAAMTPQAVALPTEIKKFEAAAAKFKVKLDPNQLKPPTHYAVLINGGWDAANNWVSFYNDLQIAYGTLWGRGYLPQNITVLNADGGGKPATAYSTVPVNQAATPATITTTFQQLAAKMLPQDTLYVMISDHGASGGLICLWGHQTMAPTVFANLVNGIKNYSQMTFVLDLCHSGAIIPALRGNQRILLAACDAASFAHDHRFLHFGALNYAVVSAALSHAPFQGQVNANANGDSLISLAEIFNWVRVNIQPAGPQTTHYEDNAATPDTTQHLPQGSNGAFGAGKGI